MARTTEFPEKYATKSIICNKKTFEIPTNTELTIVKTVNNTTELRYRAKYESGSHPFLELYKFLLSNKELEYNAYLDNELMETWTAPFDVDCRISEISLYGEYYIAETLTVIIYENE